jgi:hypothetical protein
MSAENTPQVCAIKRSWYGNSIPSRNVSMKTLFDFHLLDNGKILNNYRIYGVDVSATQSIPEFQEEFAIDISKLINS